jgi:acid phosphatase
MIVRQNTHPSEPNYVSAVGGEYFGLNSDAMTRVPANVSTIVDLLEDKGISWAEYMEDMPSSGFQGMEFKNPVTGANDYVRKHK